MTPAETSERIARLVLPTYANAYAVQASNSVHACERIKQEVAKAIEPLIAQAVMDALAATAQNPS